MGEAYTGAVFRALQREDLLPLPGPLEGPVRVRLANELRETDWTDLAQLVLVDHDPRARAVSRLLGGPPLLVGPPTDPVWVRDLEGRDVTAQVRRRDGVLWQSDLGRASRRSSPLLREGLVASFGRPPPGVRPVLELTLVNSAWLDELVMRFLGLLGDLYPLYSWSASRPSEGPEIRRWRQREGIDFGVEVHDGQRWIRIADVPPVGAMAPRHLAVPLPLEATEARRGELEVRITGGPGFLRVDRLALSGEARGESVVYTLSPAVARDSRGEDARQDLKKVDGRYHRLTRIGDHLDLTFQPPPLEVGRQRDVFLRTVGFYSPWKPQNGTLALGKARAIWQIPGGLAHFSHEMVQARHRELRATTAQVRQ